MAKQIGVDKIPRKVKKRRHLDAPMNHSKKLGPKCR